MKASKEIINTVLGIVFAVCLIFTLLISSVELVCYYNPGYFEREYEKYDVLSRLPEMTMSDEDGLMKVTEHMMDYLRGREDELQVYVMMDGEERGFFTDREIAHMEDVKDLFMGAIFLRRLAVATAVLIVIILGAIDKKVGKVLGVLSRGMLVGTVASAVICGVFGAIIATNFTEAFVTFHHIFFDNDLWILDPSVDMLINIVPEGFFFDTAARILGIFVGSILVLCILSALYLRHMRRGRQRSKQNSAN